MKTIRLLAIFSLAGAVAGQALLTGFGLKKRSVRSATDICARSDGGFKHFCNGDLDSVCDSKGLVKCNGTQVMFELDCGGSFPFCDESSPGGAKCTNVRNSKCSPPVDFECIEQGLAPDPLNCRRYYDCYNDGSGWSINAYECTDNYVFDPSSPKTGYCRLSYNNDRWCIVANCSNQVTNKPLNYPFLSPGKGQYVATCRGSKSPMVFRCKEGFVADMNTMPVECRVNCVGPDKYEFPEDDTKYYECVLGSKGWEEQVRFCFRGQYFNSEKKLCEARQLATTSTTQSPILIPTARPDVVVEPCTQQCKCDHYCGPTPPRITCGGFCSCVDPCIDIGVRENCVQGCIP